MDAAIATSNSPKQACNDQGRKEARKSERTAAVQTNRTSAFDPKQPSRSRDSGRSDGADELRPERFAGVRSIRMTAGASAPKVRATFVRAPRSFRGGVATE